MVIGPLAVLAVMTIPGVITLSIRASSDGVRRRSQAPRRAALQMTANVDRLIANAVFMKSLGAECSVVPPNDIEFSGERKRVRCNEGLDPALPGWSRAE